MSLIQRLLRVDNKLSKLGDASLYDEYKTLWNFKGTKFYLKLNAFEKKLGIDSTK